MYFTPLPSSPLLLGCREAMVSSLYHMLLWLQYSASPCFHRNGPATLKLCTQTNTPLNIFSSQVFVKTMESLGRGGGAVGVWGGCSQCAGILGSRANCTLVLIWLALLSFVFSLDWIHLTHSLFCLLIMSLVAIQGLSLDYLWHCSFQF